MKIDESFTWKPTTGYLSVKLKRAIALLFKIRKLANSSIHAWSKTCNATNRLVILKKKY